jgi:hypothetical protein
MAGWEQRPIEVASLFNPAFCSIILRQSILGFQSQQSDGMSYALSFLVLPIILHNSTRNQLPRIITSKMHSWINQHSELRVQFPERARNLRPFVREGLIYGLQAGLFSLSEKGKLIMTQKALKLSWKVASEPNECAKKAEFVGRWFAQAGDPITIFHMWGIRP